MVETSVIILNWNQPELTINCVNSVLKQGYDDFEIILVDNDSKDDSVKRFKSNFGNNPIIKIIANSENTGYTGGNNLGLRNAEGEYIIVLNNDTIVEKNWLSELVGTLKSEPNLGAAMSHVLEANKKDLDYTDRYFTTNIFGRGILKPAKGKLVDVFMASGCSFAIKRKDIKQLFPPEYFIYAEDTHLSWLLRIQGDSIKANKESIVHHHHNVTKKSSSQVFSRFTFLGERNRLINILTFNQPWTLARIMPLLAIDVALVNAFEPGKILMRGKSYLWLLTHPRYLLNKRKELALRRKVPDSEILKIMSCKFHEEELVKSSFQKKLLKALNAFSRFYCGIVGLKTIEHK